MHETSLLSHRPDSLHGWTAEHPGALLTGPAEVSTLLDPPWEGPTPPKRSVPPPAASRVSR